MVRRGQAEILVVVGVVVVISLAVFYAFQSGLIVPSSDPSSVGAQQRTLRDSVNNLIRSSALRTINDLSASGGYIDGAVSSVTFLNKPVPYWYYAGSATKPNVLGGLESSIEEYVTAGKATLEQSEDRVSFGPATVSVQLSARRMDIVVDMPTTVSGVSTDGKYAITLPTHFGDIIDFSSSFVDSYPEKHYLEVFTASSLFLSPMKDGVQSVPVILRPQCGEILTRTSLDVLPEAEEVIRTTLANTYLTDKVPTSCSRWTQVGDDWVCARPSREPGSAPRYEVPQIGAKSYSDLDVSFHLPDNFALDYTTFQMTPDPAIASFTVVPFFGTCVPDQQYIQYYISYPAIVRVKDPETQAVFQFAIDVSVKDNAPNPTTTGYASAEQTQLCSTPLCSMKLSVADAAGVPVDDAQAVYLGCPLGKTVAGVLEAPAPCGAGTLQVRTSGYATSLTTQNSDSIRNLQLTVQKIPRFTLQLREAAVVNNTVSLDYTVPTTSISSLLNKRAFLTFSSQDTGAVYSLAPSGAGATVSTIPPGRYAVSAALTEADGTRALGGASFETEITAAFDGATATLTLPVFSTFSSLDESRQVQSSLIFGELFRQCNLGPLTLTPSTQGCLKPHRAIFPQGGAV